MIPFPSLSVSNPPSPISLRLRLPVPDLSATPPSPSPSPSSSRRQSPTPRIPSPSSWRSPTSSCSRSSPSCPAPRSCHSPPKQRSPRHGWFHIPATNHPGPLPLPTMAAAHPRRWPHHLLLGIALGILLAAAEAWTGEIRGRVVCDVCGDAAIGPEDHALEGAEVAVLCITKSGEVINYQAFTNSKGMYTVAETMPESDRWDSCLARPISSFHLHCMRRGDAYSGVKFTYNKPSGDTHTVKTFLYKPVKVPLYCS